MYYPEGSFKGRLSKNFEPRRNIWTYLAGNFKPGQMASIYLFSTLYKKMPQFWKYIQSLNWVNSVGPLVESDITINIGHSDQIGRIFAYWEVVHFRQFM
jgi:hypothetical protein